MRRAASVFTAAILTVGLTTVGFAQECKVPLFSGNTESVELGSWGSGSVEVDDEESYLEGKALKVETTGFFAGARLDPKEPLDAGRFLSDPEGGYMKLVVKIHEAEPVEQGPTGPEGGLPGEGMFPGEGGMMPGEMGAPAGERPPDIDAPIEPGMEPGIGPGMGPGMEPGMGPGMEPGMGGPSAQPEPPEKIEQLRALIVTDRGAIDSGRIEIAQYTEIVEDWVEIVLPLDRFAGPVDISEGKIQHLAFFGDVEETFWLGEVTLGYEEQPLLADAGENMTTRVDTETQFEAAPQPEGVNGTYVWDFDDLDGIQEEGFGRETEWRFLTPGYYTVTLTVTAPDGDKVKRVDRVNVRVTK